MKRRDLHRPALFLSLLFLAPAILSGVPLTAQRSTDTVVIRGKPQEVRLYGRRGGMPVIVSSGDGGWIHLGPHVAAVLSAKSYFVVGFDARAYLLAFTAGNRTLSQADVPGDYETLIRYAAGGSPVRPVLIGVSEGAGLSVLAATGAGVKAAVDGVIGLGLPDINELGWRWRDMIIYVTKSVPDEPTFSAASVVADVSPLPLAAIHSTNDEFVPLAQIRRLMDRAREPKKLWIVKAADHRFSDNEREFDDRLMDALAWVRTSRTDAEKR
jgi:fermentation-respiration switch protein FrsA (DUF1100 family)